MAQQANFNRDPKKRSHEFLPVEFNPYRKRIPRTRRTLTPEEFSEIFGE